MAKERHEEWAKIGTNIKLIKKANKITWHDFAEKVGIGESKLSKGDGGTVQFFDSDLFLIQLNTGIPAALIRDLDPEDFEKMLRMKEGSRSFSGSETIEKILKDEKYDVFFEVLEAFFPLVYDDQCLASESFVKAYLAASQRLCLSYDELMDIIKLFSDSLKEGASDAVYANMQTCLIIMYLLYKNSYQDIYEFKDLLQNKPKSVMEMISIIQKNNALKSQEEKERKKLFFENASELLNMCYSYTIDSKEYKEFEEFIIVVRYFFNVFDDDEFEKNPRDYYIKCESLFGFLLETRNKYALKMVDLLTKIYK